ncbi:MAG: ABC transporter ATP-binding protein [Deltaproteobacteria bacterium]|nr:ABC transporter ATP-binding protein [Deltaproteobacteria bacterium]
MDNYRRLLTYVRPHVTRLLAAMACMVILALCTGAIAYLTKPALDDIFINKDVLMLRLIPLAIVVVALLKGLSEYFQAYLMAYVGLSIVRDLRSKIYEHLQNLSISFFTRTPTGVLISRITNDVTLIQRAVSDALTSVVKDVFTIVCLISVIIYNDWRLAGIALLIMPWAVIPIYKFGKRVRKFTTRGQEKMADMSTQLHETITGQRIIKAFGMESFECERFSNENRAYFRYILKRMKVKALSAPVMETFGILVSALFIIYGGHAVIDGTTTPGSFFSSMVALMMLYEPVKRINKANHAVQEGLAGATRIFSILDTRPEVVDQPNARELSSIQSGIIFENVSFKYEDDLVLKNINLAVKAGQIVALVGPSGAGKTTLVNLLPRFHDVSEGRVFIDNNDIRTLSLRSLRGNIGLVTQQTILFNDTIRYNISYGNPEKTEEEIISAARAANAHDFIQKLPQGYDTIIGEQGVKISGGEKQRLTIARAILKNAPILILDEATSSLDSESELAVQEALENLMVNRTTIVIAHRLSTIKKASKIVVLSHGKMLGEGRHEELLQSNLVYKKLYKTQFHGYHSDSYRGPSSLEGEIQPATSSV